MLWIATALSVALLAPGWTPEELAPAWWSPALRSALAAGISAAMVIWASLIARRAARDADSRLGLAPADRARYGRARQRHQRAWWLSVLAISVFAGWGQLIRSLWPNTGIPVLVELLTVAPAVGSWLASQACFSRAEQALSAADADYFEEPSAPFSRVRYMVYHVRQDLGVPLAMLLIVSVCGSAANLAHRLWPAGPSVDGWSTLAFAALMLAHPFLLAWVWPTAPMADSPIRARLLAALGRWRLKLRELRLWDTGKTVANAGVMGFFPWQRIILLSDVLVQRLTPLELEAVVAHEAGHIAHRHLLHRFLVLMAPFAAMWALLAALPAEPLRAVEAWFGTHPLGEAAVAAGGLAALLAILLASGKFHRLLEYQADLFACEALVAELDEAAARRAREYIATTNPRVIPEFAAEAPELAIPRSAPLGDETWTDARDVPAAPLSRTPGASPAWPGVEWFRSTAAVQDGEIAPSPVPPAAPEVAGLLEPPPRYQAAQAMIDALRKAHALNGMSGYRRSWQHPSLVDRVAVLQAWAIEPESRARLDRTVRRMWLATFAVYAAIGALAAGGWA